MSAIVGKQSFIFEHRPKILATGSVVGPKEGNGPLGQYFDDVWSDEKNGTTSWEKAESLLMQDAIQYALTKGGLTEEDLQFIQIGRAHV